MTSELPGLIGLCGRAYAGKDTLGAFLVSELGYKRVAFADKVKEAVVALDPVLYTLPGDVVVHLSNLRMASESAVKFMDRLKSDIPEARRLMQAMGNEVGQGIFGQMAWVDLALDNVQPMTVLTDVRYPHEADAIQTRGGCVLRITRPDVRMESDHLSETKVDEVVPDVEVLNNGSVADLFHNAGIALKGWWAG